MKNKNNSNFYLLTVLVFLFLLGNSQWLAAQDPLVIENDTVKVNGTLDIKLGNINLFAPKESIYVGRSTTNNLLFDPSSGTGLNSSASMSFNIDTDNSDNNTRYFDFRVNGAGFSGGTSVLRVREDGNVGIGTENPGNNKLSVNGGLRVEQHVSIGSNHDFAVDAVNIPGGRFVIIPNGNVGIGEDKPGYKLDLGDNWGKKLALYSEGTNFYGFGVSANFGLEFYTPASTVPKMVIKDDGFDSYVGIGTTDPKFTLHVGAASVRYLSELIAHEYTGLTSDGQGRKPYTPFPTGVSILTDGDIISWAGVFAKSDIRLKKNILPTSTLADLSTLQAIEVVDYTMIDDIADNRSYKKVIAQQVQEVYPLAVREGIRSFVPSVFQTSQVIEAIGAGEYRLAVVKDHELAVDDRVDLKCYPGNSSVTATVSRIISPTEFVVQSATDLSANAFIFVYGKEVDDLLSVDYDAIAMLNVSATQELAKQVSELQKENEQLKQNFEALKELVLQLQAQAGTAQKVKRSDD